jgi:asparagine synthase (glutamine-hydrolysing)
LTGICGLVRLDGRQVDARDLSPLLQGMRRRGSREDIRSVPREAAFGIRLPAAMAGAMPGGQPVWHEGSGSALVASARLDNREELAARLGISCRGRSDAELILEACLSWGEEAPRQLLGDYAFAFWDGRQKRLVAARDPAGMRQLHYAHVDGRLLVFATDEQALAAHPDVPSELNETRVADHLEDLEGADLCSTFHRHILRLPPAHVLLLERGQVRLSRFFTPEAREPLRLGSDRDYAEAFLHHFQKAVKARLRGGVEVASMLSGGLDSSSVSAVAARLSPSQPFPVLSAVALEDPACVETAMIRAVQEDGPFRPLEVTAAMARERAAELRGALARTNPFDGHMTLVSSLYHQAREAGCSTVLDGAGGDVVLAHGAFAARLLRRGAVGRALAEARGSADFWNDGTSASRFLLDEVRAAFLPDWLRSLKASFVLRRDRLYPASPLLRDDFARKVGLAERREELRRAAPRPSSPYPADRAATVLHPNLIVARERYDRVASFFGVEASDPFTDLRLIGFALSLPGEQLVRRGWTKFVLRQAMDGLLPESVRWRRGKTHLGAGFVRVIAASEGPVRLGALVDKRQRLEQWVRPERLEEALAGAAGADLGLRDRLVHLALWLDAREH